MNFRHSINKSVAEIHKYIKSRPALCMEANCFSKVKMTEYHLTTGFFSINSYTELTYIYLSLHRKQIDSNG